MTKQPRPINFDSSQHRDEWIQSNADYFTVVRKLPPPAGYERHECQTLKSAESLAKKLANEANRAYLIYAVAGDSSSFVRGVQPDLANRG